MADPRPHALIVMGVAGCGKSSLGLALAKHFAMPYLEGDSFHPAANIAKMTHAIALTDDDRWPWLHDLGRALALAASEKGRAVAACSALKRAYRDALRASVSHPLSFICLVGEREVLARRMAARHDHYMPAALLDSQLAIFEPPTADEAATMVSIDLTPEAQLEAALAGLARWV